MAVEDDRTPSPAQPAAEGRVVVVPPGGSKSAFDVLFEEHSPYVMKLLLARKDMAPASAEDLRLLVFETLNELMESGECPEDPRALLARIADNKVRTHKQKKKLPVDRSSDPREMASREANPEEALDIAQRRRMLAVHLEKMPPDAAELIQFLDIIGMSHEQVAEIRKIPLNTVASQHARAVAKLRRLVQAAERRGR